MLYYSYNMIFPLIFQFIWSSGPWPDTCVDCATFKNQNYLFLYMGSSCFPVQKDEAKDKFHLITLYLMYNILIWHLNKKHWYLFKCNASKLRVITTNPENRVLIEPPESIYFTFEIRRSVIIHLTCMKRGGKKTVSR